MAVPLVGSRAGTQDSDCSLALSHCHHTSCGLGHSFTAFSHLLQVPECSGVPQEATHHERHGAHTWGWVLLRSPTPALTTLTMTPREPLVEIWGLSGSRELLPMTRSPRRLIWDL